MERCQEILNEEDLLKPDLPEDFDEAAARDSVKAKFMSIRRRPGKLDWVVLLLLVLLSVHVCVCVVSVCVQGMSLCVQGVCGV